MDARPDNLYASQAISPERCRSVLESLLAPVAGQRAAELSQLLVAEFHSVKAVLAARRSYLQRIIPEADDIVRHIADLARAFTYCLRLNVRPRGQAVSVETTIEFLKFRIGFEPAEVFYALYFDTRGQLIHDGVVARGRLDAVNPSPRVIMQTALDIGAAGIVIAHNHPSGDPTPSRADISFTYQMVAGFKAIDLQVYDHLVVCRHDAVSMRQKGLI